MNIYQWAIKWNIPYAAIHDFQVQAGLISTDLENPDISESSETGAQNRVRLEASRKGCRLWRNNVGATYTDDGSFLRYGLANDTKQLNARVKSSDLIGIRPVTITPGMVGAVIGQFLAREIKKPGWQYVGTKAETAQLNFLNIVWSLGGDAAFANKEGTI